MSTQDTIIKFRSYQEPAFWSEFRTLFLLWCRQKGKSYTLANKALSRMMQRKNHLCTFVSASITLGTEFVRKEADVWATVIEFARDYAKAEGFKLTTNADDDQGKLIDIDGIADLFEHSKLESRIWHTNTICSRSRVIAANPDTAVGWTGDIFMDEVGRIAALKDVFEAVQPFMDSNPEFILWMATTPPPDDAHYSYEMFLPPVEEFPVNPRGNWYVSPSGIDVHRVDTFDGAAAGVVPFHPKTGEEIPPEEHRNLAFDKAAWDRNHACKFISGGTAALSLAAIQRAMALGSGGQTLGINITDAVTANAA